MSIQNANNKHGALQLKKNPLGLYVGFNQVLVYSDNSVDAIDILRQEVKWSVSLKNVYKLHINYPVIVLFYTDRSLKAFDYFTSLQLWQRKKTSFENMMETSTNLWLVSKNMLHKLDIISGDIVEKVELKALPNKIVGDEIHLFYQTDKGVYYFNKYSQQHDYIENTTSIKDVTSELILLANKDNTFSLRTFSNRLVSENAQSNLIRVDSPTRSYFAFINEKNIEFIRDKKSVVYEFTTDLNSDKIDYIYRLNNKLHVFLIKEKVYGH